MNTQYQVIPTQDGFQLAGSLVYANASDLLGEVNAVLKNHQESLLNINCEELSRLDSAGIALLIEWKRWCNNHNKQCHFQGLPTQANSLIETYRLQEVLLEVPLT